MFSVVAHLYKRRLWKNIPHEEETQTEMQNAGL